MSTVRFALGLLAWGGALYSVLLLGMSADASANHSEWDICGPWGCGPPIQALIGWHGFWILLLTPPALLLIPRWKAEWLRMAGRSLLAIALIAVASIVIYQASTWLPRFSPGEATYFIRRCLFSVATTTDIPVLGVFAAGWALLYGARLRSRCVPVATQAAPGKAAPAKAEDARPAAE